MPTLDLTFASGQTSLEVSRFSVHEGISSIFAVSITALSDDPDIDLDTIVGRDASFHAVSGFAFAKLGGARLWSGICNSMQLVRAERAGKSTYHLRIVPRLWLLTQRRGHRIYQHLTIPDIADKLLAEWSINPSWNIDRAAYPKLEYKVQYGESDYAFLSRLLEEAGIAFTFPNDEVNGSQLTLHDKLHASTPRATDPLSYVHNPSGVPDEELLTQLHLGHDVRPGAHAVRDFDFRNPTFKLLGEAPKATKPEDRYEQFHYQPGAFLAESRRPADTPAADDKGPYRHDQTIGNALAQRALEAERAGKRAVSFVTNTVDLWPGVILAIKKHPHPDLPDGKRLLVTEFFLDGTPGDEWHMSGNAVFADVPYRPPERTPRPEIHCVQSATVVGPSGQEIHTDEFGRVRVQFPWDREGKRDDSSSAWIRVSQGWAGTGFGGLTLPRVGQEVLVSFLNGDPEQPIVVARVHNMTNPVAYKLPENKTRGDWKSNSSPGSHGWNEILFEDLAGEELVYMQAQKNLRRLVKNDETITVGQDREKHVEANETDTTIGSRTEATEKDRVEEISGSRTTAAKKTLAKLIKGDEIERTQGRQIAQVGKDRHIIIKKTKRELLEQDFSVRVSGSDRRRVGAASLSTSGLQEKVGANHALEAGLELHEKAGKVFVAEGAADVTIKGPGGFLRIDATGVTISGTLVQINEGGSAGSALDAKPGAPEKPREADVAVPLVPPPPKLVDPTVTIGRVMRGNPYVESNANAADGMVDSVPPTKSYKVQISVSPQLEPGRFIELSVLGSGGANGSATVTPRQISTTTTVTVTGGAQTDPGNAGNLKIQAKLDGVVKAESAGFTVCAHPINYVDTYYGDVNETTRVGVIVQDDWHSDSDTFTDLDKTEISEIVEQANRTVPPFRALSSLVIHNSGYLAGDKKSTDTHSEPRPPAGPAGVAKKNQLCIFKCDRCGVTDKTMPNSGFHIIHEVFKDGSGTWKHTTKKIGAAVKIRAWDTGAGQANVTSPEHVLP